MDLQNMTCNSWKIFLKTVTYVLVICNDILIFKLLFFLRINGLMTIRNAIIICETDNNCAGFTYKGPIWDLDEIYDVYFFRWVHIFVLKFVSFVDEYFPRIFCWHLEKFKYLSADRFIPIMKFFKSIYSIFQIMTEATNDLGKSQNIH